MAIYAIGDVQGCYSELRELLREVKYRAGHDVLWFTGDLVNRGPKSLDVLRFVADLDERSVTVLGNHDLHMLAVGENRESYRKNDTFRDVLDASDGEELLNWLRRQRLLYHDTERAVTLVHAGLVPQWGIDQARGLAREVESALQGPHYRDFFQHMYGNEPNQWGDNLAGWDRLRFITNTMTRLRFCTTDGRQALKDKGGLGSQPEGYMPWFSVPGRRSAGDTILFGHWAALGAGVHGNVYALDSGCAWGGKLTALAVDSQPRRFYSVPCSGYADIKEL